MKNLAAFALVAFAAVTAFAQMEAMHPFVAPDGTIVVTRPVFTSDFAMTSELIAVSPAGTTLWKWQGGPMMGSIAAGATRLYVATHTAGNVEEIVALSLTTGAVQWRREISGTGSSIELAGDRLYVVSGMASGMIGMPGRGRAVGRPGQSELALTALDAATGNVLWTIPLR